MAKEIKFNMFAPVWLGIAIVLWGLEKVSIWVVLLILASHIDLTWTFKR